MPAIPHTITSNDFSHCAFTGKVLRFAPMMQLLRHADGSPIYEVYHYGVEGSESGADVDVMLFSRSEWDTLRRVSHRQLFPDAPPNALSNAAKFVGDLANVNCILYEEFNARLKVALATHYRSKTTDIVCIPFGPAYIEALKDKDYAVMETGIGYNNPYLPIRVYESLCWYHYHLGRDKEAGKNFHFVVPNYFDATRWPLSTTPVTDRGRPRVGFFGRVCDAKGVSVVGAVAERCPDIDFVICGQGDPRPFLKFPNMCYMPPIHGDARAEYLGSLHALLAPTMFVEPFCGVSVEAQLCGTPVIGPAYGATTETVEHGRTGLLAHTLADYVTGVRMAVAGGFDRAYIRERAVAKYSLEAVAPLYHTAFQTALDLFKGVGWYTTTSHVLPDRFV
jgi:glycosyltransferase involved in cell wall biosynthesis